VPGLFDSYLMVDWSAAATPKRGPDSIWIARLDRREGGGFMAAEPENPPTRAVAAERIAASLSAALAEGRSVLAGFDFPLGYPAGFAARLGLVGPPWRALWCELAGLLADDSANRNNRFALAADLNRRISGEAYPFWGRPAAQSLPELDPRHHRRHPENGLAERRLVERRARTAQTVWKLTGAGSVGSQALTGIPVLEKLRREFDGDLSVWPYETGLTAPVRRPGITLAEIYPSLFAIAPEPGEVKDAAQVRTAARRFAEMDDAGTLPALFAGDPALSAEERRLVEAEEGWVLGVTGPIGRATPPRPTLSHEGRGLTAEPSPLVGEGWVRGAPARPSYLKDPAAIYAESFAIARRETDLSRLPAGLRGLAMRLVHAVADPAVVDDLVWSEGAAEAGRTALAAGAPILVDVEMVAYGITKARLPAQNAVFCALNDAFVPDLARKLGTTRSAAAVELWRDRLDGAVVAIGNAPTALFHLLEMIAREGQKPALILGFPVGFVGAAESKAALAANRLGLAYVALKGRRGGSALAAAAINALAGPAEEGL
jgi:precorrin-8X/cobalt-precorrin-8 methylmutase